MTFSYAVSKRIPLGGGKFLAMGTYTNGSGDTGGTIISGFSSITAMDSSCGTSQSDTANLMTASGGTITLTTVDNEDGTWWALGRL
jgi:hypothetical protein